MLPGPRSLWKEPRRGGQDRSASRSRPSASPGLCETLTLHPELAQSPRSQSQLPGLYRFEALTALLAGPGPPHPPLCTETTIQHVLSHAPPNRFAVETPRPASPAAPRLPAVP